MPTFGEFSKTLWMVYLKNKRVKHSTVDSYGSVLRHHLSPVFEKESLSEITPAELSIFFDELGRKVSTKFIPSAGGGRMAFTSSGIRREASFTRKPEA